MKTLRVLCTRVTRAGAEWAMRTVKQSHRWRIGIAFAAVTIAFTIQGALLLRLINRADTSRDALCLQRRDLDDRIRSTSELLKKHPHDKFIFAIPRDLIVTSNNRDKITRHNLSILDCKEEP